MAHSRARWLIAAVVFSAALLPAQVEFPLQTNVAFPFMVADTKIPAGNCTFIINSGKSRFTVRSKTASVTIPGGNLVFTGDPISGKMKNELIFHRVAEEWFLREVWIHNQGLSLAKPKRQSELEKTGASATEVKLVVK